MRKSTLILSLLLVSTLWAQDKYTYFSSSESGRPRKGILLDNGEELLPAQFKYIFYVNSHFFVYNDSLWAWYNNAGKLVVEPQYEDVGYGLADSFLRVKKNGVWGYIDIYGNEKIPFLFEFACNFENGKAYVVLNGKVSYINHSGKVLPNKPDYTYTDYCPEDTDIATELPNGFDNNPNREIVQHINGLYGVTDSSGIEIIPPVYNRIGIYWNGVIEVEKNGKYGAYKDDGSLICEPKYDELGLFDHLR